MRPSRVDCRLTRMLVEACPKSEPMSLCALLTVVAATSRRERARVNGRPTWVAIMISKTPSGAGTPRKRCALLLPARRLMVSPMLDEIIIAIGVRASLHGCVLGPGPSNDAVLSNEHDAPFFAKVKNGSAAATSPRNYSDLTPPT